MSNTAAKVINIALAEEGYLENPKVPFRTTTKCLTPRKRAQAVTIIRSTDVICTSCFRG